MFNNSSKIMFMMMLVTSVMISISANSWLSAWMGLEINLLAFIPLMSDNKLMSTESSLKYFLTQALASCILLFSIILVLININEMNKNFMEMIIFSSLLMKSGAAPFHFWFPVVMEGLSWFNSMILMTLQKIAPLMLMSYVIIEPLMIISILFSSMIGALGGLNQTSLRKLMAYSSINHLSWMMMAMFYSNTMLIIYLFFYTILTSSMIFLFFNFKISHINQMFTLFFNSKNLKFFLLINLMSLGGLPPFTGFLPKLLIIQLLTVNNQLFILSIMLFMTLITLYYYIRLSYSAFLLNYFENNWLISSKFNNKNMKILMALSYFSTFGLFLISSLYFLF